MYVRSIQFSGLCYTVVFRKKCNNCVDNKTRLVLINSLVRTCNVDLTIFSCVHRCQRFQLVCQFLLQNKSAPIDHLATVSVSVFLQYICQFCYKTVRQKHHFIFHLRAVHKIGKPVQCEHCGRQDFKNPTTFAAHVKTCAEKKNSNA